MDKDDIKTAIRAAIDRHVAAGRTCYTAGDEVYDLADAEGRDELAAAMEREYREREDMGMPLGDGSIWAYLDERAESFCEPPLPDPAPRLTALGASRIVARLRAAGLRAEAIAAAIGVDRATVSKWPMRPRSVVRAATARRLLMLAAKHL